MEVWKPDRHVRFMRKGSILRIHGTEPFRLRWSSDGWKSQHDTESSANALEIDFVDLPVDGVVIERCLHPFHFLLAQQQSMGRTGL